MAQSMSFWGDGGIFNGDIEGCITNNMWNNCEYWDAKLFSMGYVMNTQIYIYIYTRWGLTNNTGDYNNPQ